jgi:hypothetical protein
VDCSTENKYKETGVMNYETRQVNPGQEYSVMLKLSILQHSGVILREEELWLYVSWPDEEAAQRFEEDRMKPQQRQEQAS